MTRSRILASTTPSSRYRSLFTVLCITLVLVACDKSKPANTLPASDGALAKESVVRVDRDDASLGKASATPSDSNNALPATAPTTQNHDDSPLANTSATPDDSDVPQGLSKEFVACMASAGSQNIPRADCLMDERDRQDARLNKVYKALIGQLQGDRKTRMVEAQRAWVQLQQKDGVFEASILDELGPIGSQQQAENEARAIARRAELLEQYLEFSKP